MIGSLRSALSTFKKDPRNQNRPVVCYPAESTNPENPDSDNVRPKILDAPRRPPGASQMIGSLRSALSTFKIDPRNQNRSVVCNPAESTNPENPDSDNVRPTILDAPRRPPGASQMIGSLRSALSTFKIDPRNQNRSVVCNPAESTNPENPDSDNVRPTILDAPRRPPGASQKIGS